MEETRRSTVQAQSGGSASSTGPSSSSGQWTRVIVLAASPDASGSDPSPTHQPSPTSELSEALTNEFQRRDWFAVVVHDPYLALAELALRERAQSSRAAWGLQRMEGLALVVVEPSNWPQDMIRDLFNASRRWLPPSVTLWIVERDHISSVPLNFQNSAGIVPPPASAIPKDMDALIAALPRGPVTPPPPSNGSQNPSPSKPERLSREEIDMLLMDDHASESDDAEQTS